MVAERRLFGVGGLAWKLSWLVITAIEALVLSFSIHIVFVVFLSWTVGLLMEPRLAVISAVIPAILITALAYAEQLDRHIFRQLHWWVCFGAATGGVVYANVVLHVLL